MIRINHINVYFKPIFKADTFCKEYAHLNSLLTQYLNLLMSISNSTINTKDKGGCWQQGANQQRPLIFCDDQKKTLKTDVNFLSSFQHLFHIL